MSFLLALTSAFSHAMGSVSVRMYQTKLQRTTADLRLFQCLYIFVAAVGYLILCGGSIQLDRRGFWLALAYGVDLATCFMMSAACYIYGPMSLSGIIVNACVVLPIAVGCIWYNEKMTATQILGCVLLAVTFLLSGLQSEDDGKKTYLRWYPMVFLAFLLNGMGAVLLNIYGRSADGSGQNSFLTVGYFFAAVLLFAVFMLYKKEDRPKDKGYLCPLLLVLIAVSSMGSFIGNGMLMRLNTAMPASVLYPLVNGGNGVFVAIASCAVFKEKLTWQRLAAIVTGLAAIVILNV